jgi:hypothetical protein
MKNPDGGWQANSGAGQAALHLKSFSNQRWLLVLVFVLEKFIKIKGEDE